MENYLKKFLDTHKEQIQQNRQNEITSAFNVAVRDDKLWITHDGYGIKEIDPETTAEEIVAILNNFKNTAIRYR